MRTKREIENMLTDMVTTLQRVKVAPTDDNRSAQMKYDHSMLLEAEINTLRWVLKLCDYVAS